MQRTTELKWGLIFTATALLWMVLERLAGLHGPHIEYHGALTNLFAIPAIAVYVFALREKRNRDLGGAMSWKEGFVAGGIITLVVAILAPLSQWITHTLISPAFFENAIASGVALGKTTQAEAEAYFNLPTYIRFSVVGALFMGLVTSAVVALFLRKRPEAPDAAAQPALD